jgi:hypothetical protein
MLTMPRLYWPRLLFLVKERGPVFPTGCAESKSMRVSVEYSQSPMMELRSARFTLERFEMGAFVLSNKTGLSNEIRHI